MTLGVNTDGNAYSCTVGTPRGTTYLYFENFEISVDGATIEHTGKDTLYMTYFLLEMSSF